jgi:hypothetical protein
MNSIWSEQQKKSRPVVKQRPKYKQQYLHPFKQTSNLFFYLFVTGITATENTAQKHKTNVLRKHAQKVLHSISLVASSTKITIY